MPIRPPCSPIVTSKGVLGVLYMILKGYKAQIYTEIPQMRFNKGLKLKSIFRHFRHFRHRFLAKKKFKCQECRKCQPDPPPSLEHN